MPMISETYWITQDNNDVLKAPSRLAAIPFNGVLTIEVSTNNAHDANHADISIQLPDGDVPVDGQMIPANGYDDTEGVLHNETMLVYQFEAGQGGHFLIGIDETGTSNVILRATLAG